MNSLFPDKNLIIILLLGHLIGDFIFQTNNVFKFKIKGTAGILWHSFLVGVATFTALFTFSESFLLIFSASIILFVFHFLIDIAKYKSRIEEAVTFMLDQLAHIISILICSIVLKNAVSASFRNTVHIRYAVYLIAMIVILYFLKYFIKSLYRILDIKDAASKWYSFMESAERFIIFYFSYMHGFYFLLIAFAVIPRSLYAINTNKQHIFYDIIISMLISSGAGIVFRKATILEPFTGIQFLFLSIVFFASAFIIEKAVDLLTLPLNKHSHIS
ncbi:MAG: DUF3307 domain-containing protein [bacterium]